MDFSEWIDTTLDDEKDTLCLIDAWRAGASAMYLDLLKQDLIKDRTEDENE